MSVYTQLTTSVTSTTVPTSIMPPGDRVTWVFKPRSGGNAVLVFAYSGALPLTAPANVMELTAGQPMSDADYQMSYTTDAMQQGWAAVLETSGPVIVDAIWK